MKIEQRHANAHPHLAAHVGKILAGHKIVVEGFYFAFDHEQQEKVRRAYREEFELKGAAEHLVHGQGALGHILSDRLLAARLSEKDPEFRAIQTHNVTRHENLFAPAPAPAAPAEQK